MTQKFKTLSDVIALAEFAHRNQTDLAGLPYIDHPRRVMNTVQAQGALPFVQMAAILHDVTEDTAFTPDMLIRLGVPEGAVEIVRLLDRDLSFDEWKRLEEIDGDHESFPDADTYYYDCIRQNEWAVQVKLADIMDNLQPWRLSYLSTAKQDRLKAKYAKAIELLTGGK